MSKKLQDSVIYEIYPTSFYDSNGDGIGDLNGISEKLDYVQELGADIIWFNPFFKSPFKDGGYDVQDYYAIDEKFGTMRDFDLMLAQAHKRNIKVLLDLVVGHTSDKHKWFLESKKAKRNMYSDYYIWTDSVFTGGSNTIKGMAKRDGNYMVNYYSFQPALNYGFISEGDKPTDPWNGTSWKMHYTDERLAPLRQEILNIVAFWLGKGADGFRVDLAGNMIKGGRNIDALCYFWNKIIGETKKSFPDAIFMAEWGVPEYSSKCGFDIDYFNHETRGYNETFRGEKGTNIIPVFECGSSYFSNTTHGDIKTLIDYTMQLSDSLPQGCCYCIPSGYHDIVRIAEHRSHALLKCVFVFLLTYKNVPMIYYGDEIGIRHNYKVNKDGGYIRTGARTPMQWNDEANRGFSSTNKTYLPVGKQVGVDVQSQQNDDNSLLNTVKKLVALRNKFDSLRYDAQVEVLSADYPLIYTRQSDTQIITVAINVNKASADVTIKYDEILMGENYQLVDGKIVLKTNGYVIAKVK